MSRVLLLSTTTGYQLRSFDEAAARLGVELVFATDRCHQLDDPWQDRAIAVRFAEEARSLAAIAREHRSRPFAAVLAVGDRPALLAARAAHLLGLPGNDPDAAAAAGNKRAARARFAAAGLRVPRYFVVPLSVDGSAARLDSRLRFPCVLKPLGLSGSRGVIRADTPEEFERAFERIRALMARPDVRAVRSTEEDLVLVEGFIHGREFAVEGVLTSGRLQVFTIFDKPDPLDGPHFEETIYVTPSSLDVATCRELVAYTQRAAAALGLEHGPIHAECRMGSDGIFVLEVACRPIGGLCSRALRFEDGASLEDILLRHALGQDVSRRRREPQGAAVMMIPIPRRGILRSVEGEDAARQIPHVEDIRITAKRDQLLEPLPEGGSYLGFIFARAASAGEAEAAVRAAAAHVQFRVDTPIDVTAR